MKLCLMATMISGVSLTLLEAMAFDTLRMVFLSQANLSSKFVSTVSLKLSEGEDCRSVIYGNKHYGYFVPAQTHLLGKVCQFQLVPPGYKYPIEFYVSGAHWGQKQSLKKSIRFRSPVPEIFQNGRGFKKHGELSSNFYLLVGGLTSQISRSQVKETSNIRRTDIKGKKRGIYFYVINRHGEIVWMHVLDKGRRVFGGSVWGLVGTARVVRPGVFGLMTHSSESYFELVDIEGKVLKALNPRETGVKFTIHHEFIPVSEDKILSFGSRFKYFRDPLRPFNKPRLVRDDHIIEVNLSKKTHKVLWTTLENQAVLLSRDYFRSLGKSFLTKAPTEKPIQRKPYLDVTHLNSMDCSEKGCLVSVRNENRLLFLSRDFKKTLWTLGWNVGDTYRVARKKNRFVLQHHATVLNTGNVLLFDNRGGEDQSSRILEFERKADRALLKKAFIPSPRIYSPDRGSAYWVGGANRIVAYFTTLSSGSYIVEWDYSTKKEVARMHFDYGVDHVGYQGIPLNTIGREKQAKITREAKLSSPQLR